MTPQSLNKSLLTTLAQRRRLEQRRQRRLQTLARRQPLAHRQDTVDMNNNTITAAPELDRMAILKAFGVPAFDGYEKHQKYEKPTDSDRSSNKKQELKFEFMRLRETVPTTAGTNASDLTVINEAISLICDLEAQLIQKLKCQNLPMLTVQHWN